MSELKLLRGKTAAVLGVGPGLGWECAKRFAAHGARVAIIGRTKARLEDFAAKLCAEGGDVIPVVGDINDAAQRLHIVQTLTAHFGRLDILVTMPAGNSGKRFDEYDLELSAMRGDFEVNLWGPMLITRALLDLLKRSEDGRLIFINTMAAESPSARSGAGYAGSKAALANITKVLAAELGPHKIRVNGVHPGAMTNAGFWVAMKAAPNFNETEAIAKLGGVLGFLAEPGDAADAVLFLASPWARAITGQSLHVNAGQWFS